MNSLSLFIGEITEKLNMDTNVGLHQDTLLIPAHKNKAACNYEYFYSKMQAAKKCLRLLYSKDFLCF